MLIFLKYLSLYLCSLYATDKICHIKSDFKIILLQSASLSLLVWLIAVIFPNQFAFLPFILYLGYIYIMVKNIRLSIVSGFISYGISLALMTLIGFIISSIFSLFRASYTHSPFTLITIIICLLTPPIEYKVLSIRRFKSGMPFLRHDLALNIGTVLSLIIFCIDLYVHYIPENAFLIASTCQLLGCLLILPLILWWRIRLKRSYQKYLYDTERNNLLSQIEQLQNDNKQMAQIIHKDNKLLTAMTSVALDLSQTATTYTPSALAIHANDLHNELLSLSSHRQSSLQELSGSITGDFCSDHMMINAVLSYLQRKASAQQATLTFTMDANFFDYIMPYLDEEQIAHLLADLGQNALIATVPCESRYIHIALSVTKSIPSICISDSGTPFPTIVLEHLGIEKCSQHLDEGGSGIGLMDLWKLKSSSKATLLIKEDSSPEALYTKYIYLIFDTQGRYIIESDRITALHKHLSRTDVTLINE